MAKKPAAKRTEVTKPDPSDKSLILVQDTAPDYIRATGEGRGSENVGTEDLVIPRLEIVQALSPALKEDDAGYIEGAKQGDLTNSVTRKLYGKEVYILPVHYTKQWLVWKDKKKGGGFYGAYPNPEEAKDRAEQEGGEKQGIEVMDTPTHLCLLVDHKAGKVEEIMIPMPRSKAKISRTWNSIIRLAGGDRFSRIYRFGSQVEKNDKGDYYNFVVTQSGFPAKGLYEKAAKLYEQVKGGMQGRVMDVKGYDDVPETGEAEM